jgi:hypothetical protein
MIEAKRTAWEQITDEAAREARSPRMAAPNIFYSPFDPVAAIGTLNRHFLRAQAEIIRGLLSVVEGTLAKVEAPAAPPDVKIPVE